jgi:hypothetical protein
MPITPEASNLSLINYKFKLSATPNVEYRVQSAQLPGITLGTATIQSPFSPIRLSGNVTYDELALTFLVGENMRDYMEIYNWIMKLGYPEDLKQYDGQQYEASLMILNSTFQPIYKFNFTNVIPTSLSSLSFDSTLQDVQYAQASISMSFTTMRVEDLS